MTALVTTNPSSANTALVQGRAGAANAPISTDATKGNEAAATKRQDDPATVVRLSDHAKALIEQAKIGQAVADRLSSALFGKKLPAANNSGSQLPDTPDATRQGFAPATTTSQSGWNPDARSDHIQALVEANRQADGTVKDYHEVKRDFLTVPSTPQEIDEWYKRNGDTYAYGGQQDPSNADAVALANAVRDRTLTIRNAKEIPDLNFHNEVVFEGGEHGGSVNDSFSYNKDSAIFNDPTTKSLVSSDGVVISWKVPSTPNPATVSEPA